MKRLFFPILTAVLLLLSLTAYAKDSYIEISPFPFSSYMLGEDITVKGSTDFSYVTIALFYPKSSIIKFTAVVSSKELREGYTIHTGSFSSNWPEGRWHLKVQNGGVSSSIYVNLTKEEEYRSRLYVTEYEDGCMKSVFSVPAKGAYFKNGTITLKLKDETVKIFLWDSSLSPAEGEGDLYISSLNGEGTPLFVKKLKGSYSGGFPITIKSNEKTYKLFLWHGLTPQ